MGGGGDALQIESVSNTYGWRSVETATWEKRRGGTSV